MIFIKKIEHKKTFIQQILEKGTNIFVWNLEPQISG